MYPLIRAHVSQWVRSEEGDERGCFAQSPLPVRTLTYLLAVLRRRKVNEGDVRDTCEERKCKGKKRCVDLGLVYGFMVIQ